MTPSTPDAGTVAAAASTALRDAEPGTLVVVEGPGGARFPNGYVPRGPVAETGCGPGRHHRSGPMVARRWWDATLRCGPPSPRRVARLMAATEPIALPVPPEDAIGWGPGLTPAGDDVVVGMLIALRSAGADAEADALAAAVAGADTTPFSRALIDHAAHGRAARPVLDVMAALAGQGDLGRAVSDLGRFGATSGAHLIDGIRRGLARGSHPGAPS